ncbi:hypothetical protein CAPTEDRAFT_198078 [Capitella teleta]|uniref:Uncharacterized protein n=1 Tax=Capitella teleta TaxID=283909 RepID=X1ZY98_CAPTE|nr:hypothetical protein CAPTEDRAFT_198078 [Capitella teleta]|eukprot:ELU04629.1 hypothetical protein CAPTEDRAFT_198078 [Capitella teleta]
MAGRQPSRILAALKDLRHTFRLVRQQENFVGEDEHGNRYYEKPSDSTKNLRKFRRVLPRSKDQFEVPKVPVEWMSMFSSSITKSLLTSYTAWLQGRRIEAPSEEERQRNYVLKLKTLRRAEELEEKRMVEDAERDAQKAQMTSLKQGSEFPRYEEYEQIPGQDINRKGEDR